MTVKLRNKAKKLFSFNSGVASLAKQSQMVTPGWIAKGYFAGGIRPGGRLYPAMGRTILCSPSPRVSDR
jgi:hypothetical protein